MRKLIYLPLILSLLGMTSCSHKFDSNVHSLDFYQWNLWHDSGSVQGDELPSCGWEDLHRGMGKLVRIPAPLEEHFPDSGAKGVYWYHCRFTLPEQWEDQAISLIIEEAGPIISLFLNEEKAGYFAGGNGPYEVDVSERIYYVRDNHLSIRISNPPEAEQGTAIGITGNVLVKSRDKQITQD